MLRRADLRWVIVSFNGLLLSSLYFFSNLEISVSNEVVSTFIFIVFILLIVVPQGFEPRLFWTKTRRVANYTIGQKRTGRDSNPRPPA
jgi:hypothetical protein